MQKLTNEQAAIITAYTGIATGNMSGFHEYVERKLGRPIWTHQFAEKEIWAELKEKCHKDFVAICPE